MELVMKTAIACGGTGGHTFPGIATALAMKARGHEAVLWLAGKNVETSTVTAWPGKTITVPAQGLPTGSLLKSVLSMPRFLIAAIRCWNIMRKNPPDALLAMGGYGSVGPVLAARALRAPVVLHEANVIPGRATRFLARFADTIAVAFEETKQHLSHHHMVLTGMPVMANRESDEQLSGLHPGIFTLLITGGSNGALRLNQIASDAICKLHANGVKIQAIHLTGRKHEEEISSKYKAAGATVFVSGFFRDMDKVYRESDFAVCRAGSSTCAELAEHAVPALFVPYPYAANNHQTANAAAIARAGAADIIAEKELNPDRLYDYILKIMENRDRIAGMRKAAESLAKTDAAENLAVVVEQASAQHRTS